MGWLTDRRRRHLVGRPFPPEWRAILGQNVRACDILDTDERARLEQLVQVFIDEKRWTGCDDKTITDEVRITIAGMACAMLVAREHDLLPGIEEILVYPTTFTIPADSGLYVNKRRAPRHPLPSGPRQAIAVPHGPLIVAWDAILADGRAIADGRNALVHELARHIDSLDDSYDGTPPLELPDRLAWRAAFTAAFQARRDAAERGEATIVPESALASATEYFACATELFFETPRELAIELPAVYACLVRYFGMDLAARAPTPYR